MKKFLIMFLVVLLSVCLFSCSKCNGNGDDDNIELKNNYISSTAYTFLEAKKSLLIWDDCSLTLLGDDINSTTWISDDENIVKVSNGNIFAVGTGRTNIHAIVNEQYDVSCEIIVYDNFYVPSIDFDLVNDKIELAVNDSYSLHPIFTYGGKIYNDAVFSYSTDSNLFSVDSDGKIIALASGEGTVKVSCSWRNSSFNNIEAVVIVSIG